MGEELLQDLRASGARALGHFRAALRAAGRDGAVAARLRRVRSARIPDVGIAPPCHAAGDRHRHRRDPLRPDLEGAAGFGCADLQHRDRRVGRALDRGRRIRRRPRTVSGRNGPKRRGGGPDGPPAVVRPLGAPPGGPAAGRRNSPVGVPMAIRSPLGCRATGQKSNWLSGSGAVASRSTSGNASDCAKSTRSSRRQRLGRSPRLGDSCFTPRTRSRPGPRRQFAAAEMSRGPHFALRARGVSARGVNARGV